MSPKYRHFSKKAFFVKKIYLSWAAWLFPSPKQDFPQIKINLALSLASLKITVWASPFHSVTTAIDRHMFLVPSKTAPKPLSCLVKGFCRDRNLHNSMQHGQGKTRQLHLSISLAACFHNNSKSPLLLLKPACIFPFDTTAFSLACLHSPSNST